MHCFYPLVVLDFYGQCAHVSVSFPLFFFFFSFSPFFSLFSLGVHTDNLKVVLLNLANKHGFDPLVADNWYSISMEDVLHFKVSISFFFLPFSLFPFLFSLFYFPFLFLFSLSLSVFPFSFCFPFSFSFLMNSFSFSFLMNSFSVSFLQFK
jgi:hypothetical protein